MAEEGKKAKAEVEVVQMADGRSVGFAGKRKVVKETLIDESKIEQDGEILQISAGAIKVRMDFRNGETRTMALPLNLLAQFAGHGAEQKYGDELASSASDPMSLEDMVLAIEALDSRIQRGLWRTEREGGGGGVSGASVVIRALVEVTGKTVDEIKAIIEKKLETTPGLTRAALYKSFRAPGTKTGVVIKRIEDERATKNVAVDADAMLAEDFTV